MLPIGHIASTLLVSRLVRRDHELAPALLGALVPDAIDKTLAWVLQIVPSARHIGHTPLAAGALSTLAAALFGRRKATAFGVAYLVHLVGDRWGGGHVPWLMPFRKYDKRGAPWKVPLTLDLVLLELAGAGLIVLLLRTPVDGGAFSADG